MTRILGNSRSAIVASRRGRRRQDDESLVGPPHALLRHHRDRQHQLAVQKPQLTNPPRTPTRAYPRGCTVTSHARRYVARGGTARRARVPPMHYVDKPTSITAEGVTIGREMGVAVGCELPTTPTQTPIQPDLMSDNPYSFP